MFEFASRKSSATPTLTKTPDKAKYSFDNARIRYNPDIAQRVTFDEDEDELLQGKFSDTVQRETLNLEDEEEPLQGKFAAAQSSPQEIGKANQTGIPDDMKARFENASGFSFDDVRIHYNSDAPAKLNALAYTQGNQVHIAPGQERHLGHELGHVVQQKQGRVRATGRIGNTNINDDIVMEKEADNFSCIQPKHISAKSFNNNKIIPIQCLAKKMSKTMEDYNNCCRSKTYLYAELNNVPINGNGVFMSNDNRHAEENLIQYIVKNYNKTDLEGKTLTIYLSTSPCSSLFDTSRNSTGCSELLERFANNTRITLNVIADHLYQPKGLIAPLPDIMAQDREWPFGSPMKHCSRAAASAFGHTISSVAQFIKII
jgi:hypothetical protein